MKQNTITKTLEETVGLHSDLKRGKKKKAKQFYRTVYYLSSFT